jgi:hypothetical protein
MLETKTELESPRNSDAIDEQIDFFQAKWNREAEALRQRNAAAPMNNLRAEYSGPRISDQAIS